MKRAMQIVLILGVLAGCQREQAAPAPSAQAGDVTTPRRVVEWPLPGMMAGSALPDLAVAPDGRLLLAWTNSQRGRRHILQFSTYDPATARWQMAPTTIAIGNSMFVNWADTPHIAATPDGALWVHWLQKRADAPNAYDIMLSTSRNGGAHWNGPVVPHDDGTTSEHGFVSLWPASRDTLGIAWLDGRNTVSTTQPQQPQPAPAEGEEHAHGAGDHGAMALRAAVFDGTLRRLHDAEIDAMTCDCCQTDVAMTSQGALLVYRGRTQGEIRDVLTTRFDGKAWTKPARVHADDWKMPACPVNGPSIDADDDAVVVGWYTAPGDTPMVRLAHSGDAGATFAAPVDLDRGEAVQGRIDVALGDGQVWALWLREDASGQSLWLSRRSADLATEHQRIEVAKLQGRGRATGFPQLAVRDGIAYIVWTDVVDGKAQLRSAQIVAH
jgi:hypothetical protein